MPGPTGPPSLRKAGAKIRTHAERANKTGDFFRRKSGKTGKHAVTQDNTRGKSSGEKEEGRETDTSIILYIRTEDEGNRYKKRRKTLLFFLVHLFRLNYVSHNQACSAAQKHTCTINDRNRTSHKPIIMFVIKILRQSNSHNRIAYQKP